MVLKALLKIFGVNEDGERGLQPLPGCLAPNTPSRSSPAHHACASTHFNPPLLLPPRGRPVRELFQEIEDLIPGDMADIGAGEADDADADAGAKDPDGDGLQMTDMDGGSLPDSFVPFKSSYSR